MCLFRNIRHNRMKENDGKARLRKPVKEFNKNQYQADFNKIKGIITQWNDESPFCSLILEVGHERPRSVYLNMKTEVFDKYVNLFAVGNRVSVTFFVTSRQKGERWYTSVNVLEIEACN